MFTCARTTHRPTYTTTTTNNNKRRKKEEEGEEVVVGGGGVGFQGLGTMTNMGRVPPLS